MKNTNELENSFKKRKFEKLIPSKYFSSLELNSEKSNVFKNLDILKIDTEGAEWDTFYQMPNEILGSFEQIVMEIHGLHSVHPDYNGTNLFKSKIERKTQVINKINKLF